MPTYNTLYYQLLRMYEAVLHIKDPRTPCYIGSCSALGGGRYAKLVAESFSGDFFEEADLQLMITPPAAEHDGIITSGQVGGRARQNKIMLLLLLLSFLVCSLDIMHHFESVERGGAGEYFFPHVCRIRSGWVFCSTPPRCCWFRSMIFMKSIGHAVMYHTEKQ
ncbi:hypothetical protein FN846DRAFT_924400 [Sphaerosporella brunnea]|uniref:Uncharacterized protein n=1 Tax=Sphaerosporella brunnea TaxID=1250544 RepID=A0A5J5FCC3_9PEZI|nr:hypothetical protein FN846DRAFT_924400 [Sphaerosporella brunnea]